MQRKATKNTRGPNADERRFQAWLKEQPCAYCGASGPSIVDHARGSTFKHNKTLIGHWFCTSRCVECDTQKTIHGKRLDNESLIWVYQHSEYSSNGGNAAPYEVEKAILDWNR